ncbi:hypothetical protein QZH41_020178 [Actinostola sp. cb2023]|nr:hypothetical protein QZH41_020178 [Actinostola sp. cb2023]
MHIHHAACGHGGERWIEGAPVDGYNPTTRTIWQFQGCYWHGCPRCYPHDRGRIVLGEKTREQFYQATMARTQKLQDAGYTFHEGWECKVGHCRAEAPQSKTLSYPHAIFYDFEAFQDKSKRRESTLGLSFENEHVSISVSVGDTLEPNPTHICCREPKQLILQFMEELDRRGAQIRRAVRANYLPARYQRSSGLRSRNGVTRRTSVPWRSRGSRTSGLTALKKLDFPGVPDYPAWYSRLKGCYGLKFSEWRACKRLFRERGMRTFGDWLRYYNDLDVGPGLEALQRMRAFYTEKGIDILKDAVSIPGVSLHYLLRGSIERGAEMFSPGQEAYEMLKGAVVGGPSIVFTRYYEVGATRIRDHKFGAEARLCRRILGYANALYLSTMLRAMPCGKERVSRYCDSVRAAQELTEHVRRGTWFEFAEVDIEIPETLWPRFEDMCAFFYNTEVPTEAVLQEMLDYLAQTYRKRGDGKKLMGALTAKKELLYALLLRWYVEHGAVIKAVYRTIDYKATKIFTWFVEQVIAARRTGDADKSKALLAEVFKLLGNSAYGKLIEALERQTNLYTKAEPVVDRALRSAYFHDLEELGEAYELESRKPRITIRRPFQIGIDIAVYQLAKLRMLEFYYDFLDRYIDRGDFELLQMNTDSNYIADRLKDIVRPELRTEFEVEKKQWLAWDKWSGRTTGLFKLECTGSRMIALCSKCYIIDDGEKSKSSQKGCRRGEGSGDINEPLREKEWEILRPRVKETEDRWWARTKHRLGRLRNTIRSALWGGREDWNRIEYIPLGEIPDNKIPGNEIPDNEIPDNEIPDNEIPGNEIPDNEIPDNEIPDNEIPGNAVEAPAVVEARAKMYRLYPAAADHEADFSLKTTSDNDVVISVKSKKTIEGSKWTESQKLFMSDGKTIKPAVKKLWGFKLITAPDELVVANDAQIAANEEANQQDSAIVEDPQTSEADRETLTEQNSERNTQTETLEEQNEAIEERMS